MQNGVVKLSNLTAHHCQMIQARAEGKSIGLVEDVDFDIDVTLITHFCLLPKQINSWTSLGLLGLAMKCTLDKLCGVLFGMIGQPALRDAPYSTLHLSQYVYMTWPTGVSMLLSFVVFG